MVYVTRGLLEALLEIGADRDPGSVTVSIATSPGGTFDADVPDDTPVFTDMYLPDTGESVAAVFGMDLSTPSADGRFLTHPDGTPILTKRDDLHEVVFVAIPPYEIDDVRAFDRSGRELEFTVVDAAPPPGSIDE